MRIVLLHIVFLLFFSGCTSAIHSYHVSDVERSSKGLNHRKISAGSKQFTVMGFVSQTDYVNKAFKKLQEKCRRGRITNIHTRHTTDHHFFSWTNRIKMTALCLAGRSVKK
ncbi:MAG: hypothetical protein OXB88_04375 [Bacteriovoracales bacterium]|nr:hypothetical protein [Bacteriovoracales bacterium]